LLSQPAGFGQPQQGMGLAKGPFAPTANGQFNQTFAFASLPPTSQPVSRPNYSALDSLRIAEIGQKPNGQTLNSMKSTSQPTQGLNPVRYMSNIPMSGVTNARS